MNWYKAKTILIIFFAAVNIFLLISLISNGRASERISEEVIEYTVKVLENNGIKISKDIIPRKNVNAKQFEADNIITDYDEFAKTVLGDNVSKLSENEYKSELGTLKFSGDCFKLIGTLNGDYADDENGAGQILNDFGIEIGDCEYSDGVFLKQVYKLDVFNSQISIKRGQNNEVSISGVWFEKNSNKLSKTGSMKPITSVLIDFITSEDRPDGEIEIKELEWGYMVYETETFHMSIVPVPVWKIILSDGTSVYMDARNN